MTHLDSSILATYNSLDDPNLRSYFSNERIQKQLRKSGLITKEGHVLSENEYHRRLAQQEHKDHVRKVVAANVVHRVIEMERMQEAENKRQNELIAKAALVNSIRESRKNNENWSQLLVNPSKLTPLAMDYMCGEIGSRSANFENLNEATRIQSAYVAHGHREKSSPKIRGRERRTSLRRRKSLTLNNSHPKSNNQDGSPSHPCQITMVYHGPHTKVDFDRLVFEEKDEVTVRQQHCGGENLIVYKGYLKHGDQFTFNSRRRSGYTFGLTFSVKGLSDSRISTCCEYKHRHGVRLGGERGHFSIISVEGSKPCVKCQYEKDARLKKYAESPKGKSDEKDKCVTVSIAVSDEIKESETPVRIPIRHASVSKDNYSDDFEDRRTNGTIVKKQISSRTSDRDSSSTNTRHTEKQITGRSDKSNSKISSSRTDLPYDSTPLVSSSRKKTWQIGFQTSKLSPGNMPIKKNRLLRSILLKLSFIPEDDAKGTDTCEINMNDFVKDSKIMQQYSRQIRVKNIGKPGKIRIKMEALETDEAASSDEEDVITWHLDHITLIDPETQSNFIFPCEKPLTLSKEVVIKRNKEKADQSGESSSSSPRISTIKKRKKASKHSPPTSETSSKRFTPKSDVRAKGIEGKDNDTDNSSDTSRTEDEVPYRVQIYTSNGDDGEFIANKSSRVYLRLNNRTNEINLTHKSRNSCPSFEPGDTETFTINVPGNEKITKLTIGYFNSEPAGKTWKIDRIVLSNTKTKQETVFPCNKSLIRDENTFTAEMVLETDHKKSTEKSKQSDDDDESTPRANVPVTKLDFTNVNSDDDDNVTPRLSKTQFSGKEHTTNSKDADDDDDDVQSKPMNGNHSTTKDVKATDRSKKSDDHVPSPTSLETKSKEEYVTKTDKQRNKSPSFESMGDDEAHYSKIFKKLDPNDDLKLGSRSNTPIPPMNTARKTNGAESNSETDRSSSHTNRNSLRSPTIKQPASSFQRRFSEKSKSSD